MKAEVQVHPVVQVHLPHMSYSATTAGITVTNPNASNVRSGADTMPPQIYNTKMRNDAAAAIGDDLTAIDEGSSDDGVEFTV